MNVHTIRQLRQRDDIDIVGGFIRPWLHRRRLHQARVAFAIAVDSRVHPVAHGNGGTSVWEAGINVTLVLGGCGAGGERQKKEAQSEGGLHVDDGNDN